MRSIASKKEVNKFLPYIGKVRMGCSLNHDKIKSTPTSILPSKGGNAGFTLAEVLITLGIIGVVAAVTVPTLIADYKNKALSSQLRKSVNTMVNGYKMMIAKEGTDGINGTELSEFFNDKINEDHFTNYMKKYFNLGKNMQSLGIGKGDISQCGHFICGNLTNDGSTSCQYNSEFSEHMGSGIYCTYNGYTITSCTCTEAINGDSGRNYAYSRVHHGGNLFNLPGCALMTQADGSEVCLTTPGQAFIDVNGFAKGPNVVGADFFEVNFSNTGNIVKTGNSIPATKFSETIENNWEIKYY